MKTLFTFCILFLIGGTIKAQNIGDVFSYSSLSQTIYYEIISLSPNQVKAISADTITGHLPILPQVNNAGNFYAVVQIGEGAFFGDNNTAHSITSVTFPEGLKVIESTAFQGNSISSVHFSSTITEISDNSFSDNLLTTVTIPALVTYLGDETFSNNPIASVTSENLTPAILYSGTFDNRSTVALTIPYGTMSEYTAAQWTGFLSITEDISINPFNGVSINTDTSGAALHVKGFTDLAGQPNVKLSNASGTDLLTIYDDGTVSGIASDQWTELPEGGQTGQVLQTDGNGNYTWVDTTTAIASQLELITEGSNTGWRLLGRDPNNYGNIGNSAVDLSISNSISNEHGATGPYSIAMGYRTRAWGSYSTAMGFGTISLAGSSTAMGNNTTASGTFSTAMGIGTKALGQASTAMGNGATASGITSTAMGAGTKASGTYSTAMGRSTTASGSYSTGMGRGTIANSYGQTVIGTYNINFTPSSSSSYDSSDRAFVVGIGATSSTRNDGFTVYKDGTLELDLLSSPPSIPNFRLYVLNQKLHYNGEVLASPELKKVSDLGIIGWRLGSDPDNYGNIGSDAVDLSISDIANDSLGASGTNSFATGYRTKAHGNYSTATGAQSKSSGYASTAMGSFARSSGRFSVALGKNTIAPSYGEIVVGAYNDSYSPNSDNVHNSNDRAFVVGTGSSNSNRRNGLIVYKNGTLKLDLLNSAPSTTIDRLYVLNSKLHYDGQVLEASQLSKITEGGNTGWRLANFDPNRYGNIGLKAVDLSHSTASSATHGATGSYSVAMGRNNIASGYASTAVGEDNTASSYVATAIGRNANASGRYSTAIGRNVTAKSFAEIGLGVYNTEYTPDQADAFDSDDRLLVVGYGSSSTNKKDALTILKDGKVGIKHNNFENNSAIAALQVNGSMKVANSGSTCNASNAGTIRYRVGSGGNGNFFGCRQETASNGAVTYSWKQLNN